MRRLEAWSHIVNRQVETSTGLTRDEGMRLARTFARVEDGAAVVVEGEDGWLRIRDWPEVPATEPPPWEPPTEELPL